MEIVPKQWEDDFLVVPDSEHREGCCNAWECKGVTARTVHGRALGKPLRAFSLPSGRSFPRCLLCIRAAVSARWYEVLFGEEYPAEPIHEWAVRVDEGGEYDSALCIGPLQQNVYCGVVGPFPRYDETTLLVSPTGFKQLCMDFKTIPRLLRPNQRVGARPLGFHGLWRTTSALLYAGYVSRVSDTKMPGAVADVYWKCVPRLHAGCSKWDEAACKIPEWRRGVVRASALGLYPHCQVRYAEEDDETAWTPKHVLFFIREHVTFLIERDSPELLRAVVRAHPKWPQFVVEVREMCDAVRRKDRTMFTKRPHSVVKRFDEVKCWPWFVRRNLAPVVSPASSPALAEMKQKYLEDENGKSTLQWVNTLPLSDAVDLRCAASWDAWRGRFDCWPIALAKNLAAQPSWWCMCDRCGAFKSVTTKWGGCVDVCLDLSTMRVICNKRRGVGRKPTLTHIEKSGCSEIATVGCRGTIIKRPFGTHVVNIDFKAFVVCVRCSEALVPFDFKRVVLGHLCDGCLAPNTAAPKRCEMCSVDVPEDAFFVRAFDDQGGGRRVFFCRAHAKPKLVKHAEVWALDLLMTTMYYNARRSTATTTTTTTTG